MSGGSFDYVHLLDGNELLNKYGVVGNLEALVKQLNSYGEQGVLAAGLTQALLLKLEGFQAVVRQMEQELDDHVSGLAKVWREVDLHASCDSSADSVRKVLAEHEAQSSKVEMAAELALADAIDDVSTPLEETGKRWQFVPELSPTPERLAARQLLEARMTPQEREAAVNLFHQKLEPVTHFASGQLVDNNFLLSIL